MAKILLIDGEHIMPLDKIKFAEESKLQDYLEEYPSLIPLADIVERASDLLCIGREVIAGPGWVDLLFIDKDGLLTIVETKLTKNSEIRREVIGQIIEYASFISQWSADDVYRVANEYFSKSDKVPSEYEGSTLDKVMEKVGRDEFSDEDFRSNIEQNLKNGKIRLIIAIDELIEPLRATVTFLNRNSTFDILLLQVSSFEESEAKKVLIPLLFGYATKTATISPTRKRWDLERFLADTRERCNPEVADVITKLHDFTNNAGNVFWGTGGSYGSFTFHKLRDGTIISIFSVYSTGWIQFNFGYMKDKEVEEELLESFRATLNEIPGISISKDAVTARKWPEIKAEALAEPENLKRFQDAVISLCQQLENSKE